MKQLKAFGPQDIRLIEAEEPVPGEGEVLVAVKACGICGSDKWFWHVREPSEYVAGHEAAGEVVAVGPGVKRLAAGDRVAVNNVRGCGECSACRDGRFVLCGEPLTHMGFGLSERIAVPERNCLRLDPRLDYVRGSLIFDQWGTPYAALKRTSMKAGDTAVVLGCGPIGLAAIALARLRGAKVAAVDPLPARREAALTAGAAIALAPGKHATEKLLAFAGDAGADFALECSGQRTSYELAYAVVKAAGTIVCIGEGAPLPFTSSDVIHKHLTLVGSLYSSMRDGEEVQRLFAEGAVDPLAFVTHRVPLEDVPGLFGRIVEGGEGLLKTVVVSGG